MTRRLTVLDAPSNLGLRPPRRGHQPGCQLLPEALRRNGIVERLAAGDSGRVEAPPYSFDPEPVTGFRNGLAIADYTRLLADRIGQLLDEGAFPVVLGGDCGILLAPMLALRRRGTYGLAHLDGHDDYSPYLDPRSRAGRFVAGGLALALATGRGPSQLCDIDGMRPYVAEEHIVHLGVQREPEDYQISDLTAFDTSAITRFPIEYIRQHDARPTALAAREHLEGLAIQGFWIHLDVDILDKAVMPAVDSPNPDGLAFTELTESLATLLASPRAVGIHIGIFDPELDPDGSIAAALTGAIVAAFTS